MPFIDNALFSLMKTHLATNHDNKPNAMVSTPIDMDRNSNPFFGDYFEYSSDEEPSSLFTKSAPQMSDDSDQDFSYQPIETAKHKSVTIAQSPVKTRNSIGTIPKDKKKVCRMLFYASKITKRSSFLKKTKQKFAEAARPEIEKESLRRLKVFFCHDCGMKIYTMSNSNTHLVTEL